MRGALAMMSLACTLLMTTATASAQTPRRSGAERVLARAREVQRRAEIASRDIAALLDEARGRHERDFQRCLDRQLAEINAHLRMIRDRYERLTAAFEASRIDEARHLYGVIRRLGRRISEVERLAYACPGGRTRSREGQVEVEVIGPPER